MSAWSDVEPAVGREVGQNIVSSANNTGSYVQQGTVSETTVITAFDLKTVGQ